MRRLILLLAFLATVITTWADDQAESVVARLAIELDDGSIRTGMVLFSTYDVIPNDDPRELTPGDRLDNTNFPAQIPQCDSVYTLVDAEYPIYLGVQKRFLVPDDELIHIPLSDVKHIVFFGLIDSPSAGRKFQIVPREDFDRMRESIVNFCEINCPMETIEVINTNPAISRELLEATARLAIPEAQDFMTMGIMTELYHLVDTTDEDTQFKIPAQQLFTALKRFRATLDSLSLAAGKHGDVNLMKQVAAYIGEVSGRMERVERVLRANSDVLDRPATREALQEMDPGFPDTPFGKHGVSQKATLRRAGLYYLEYDAPRSDQDTKLRFGDYQRVETELRALRVYLLSYSCD
jgi:hypothetical protein